MNNALDKIDLLIQESEKEREAAQPDYVTPEAEKAIDKAGIEKSSVDGVNIPDLDEGPSHMASILNKIGQAAEDVS